MSNQLIKNTTQGTQRVYPKTHTEGITDKSTGKNLIEILNSFNMYFLSYIGNTFETRCQVPKDLRREGLWITYIDFNHKVVTEWYNSDNIDDETWGVDTYWRQGSNKLIGDISISVNGNWVINGKETEFKATGDPIKPLLRVNFSANKLQVSYDDGNKYENLGDNPVYTQFRTANNKLQVSTDLGKTWVDTSEPIAAWFRWVNGDTADSVGKIQISRDEQETWIDLSPNIVNNLYIKGYVATVGELPTSTAALGDIYMVGPTYDESDSTHDYPHYRMWVKQSSGWVDNGEYQSFQAGVVQELGDNPNVVVSQKIITEELDKKVDGVYEDNPEFIRTYTDADGRLLWWINTDGSVDWAKGVPQPVQEELKKLEQLINDNLTGDEQLKERVAANEDAIVAINEALDRKVDGIYVESPEYIKTETDSEDRILNGIRTDGTNYMAVADVDRLSLGGEVVDNGSVLANYHIESPEFIRYICDSDGRLIVWINQDGSIDWSCGVPQPIQDELSRIEKSMSEGDKSLQEAIDEINAYLQETLGYVDSPEFIRIEKDAEDRIINAVTPKGVNYMPKVDVEELQLDGDVIDNDAVKSQVCTESPEFISYTIDADDRVLEGFKSDGTKYINNIETENVKAENIESGSVNTTTFSIKGEAIDNDAIKSSYYVDNPEYINIEEDADGRVLGYTKPDGGHYIHNLESETIPTEFSNVDDAENRIEIQKDADERIISYRDSNGKLHEEVGIETHILDTKNINADRINLSVLGLTEFEQALRANGFRGGQGDWSEATSLQIPEPRCAMINITSADGTPYSWPTSKFDNNKVWVEFYDIQGNYFKKRAIHNAQGSSSMEFIKKNGAFDFCNDEWVGDDTFSVKFGDWVYQDSFHAKAYYTDFFRGVSIVAYKIADQVEKSRGIFEDRPWKKALLKDYTLGTDQTNSAQIDDLTLQLNNEAKCHPDGFPCIIYLDGEFYGIYAFCLKKHRDNMHQIKDVAEHIHLDGVINADSIFNGTVSWTAFEIRNPKNLYYKEAQNGTFEYDADVAQAEIAGDEEVNAWIEAGQLPDGTEITSKIKKRLQTTAKVKNYILALSQIVPQIKSASTIEEKKSLFENFFDVDNLVDYEIVQMATGDTDSFSKNWQWTTYDGVKWWVNEYDKDMSFGGFWTGMITQSIPTTGGWMGYDTNTPIGQVILLYKLNIVERWKYLVSNGIFTTDNFLKLFNEWLNRIGTENFEKEYSKWNDSPCNRYDYVNREYWERTNVYKSDVSYSTYNSETTYNNGDKCYYGFDWVWEFKCIKQTIGNPPLTNGYSIYPKTMGYRDSIWRLSNYIRKRLEVENEFINNIV